MSTSFIENSEIDQASPNILAHHQIKGAKWGVHRGPPYPLENGISTKVKHKEKSAIKREKGETVKPSSNKPNYSFNINDPISELSNSELQARIDRFRKIEDYNKYVREIKNGDRFLTKMSKVLRQIKTTGDDINGAIRTAKNMAILLGLIDPVNKAKQASNSNNNEKKK